MAYLYNLFNWIWILVLLFLSIKYWEFVIPIILFLVYLLAIAVFMPIKHKRWFHGLWIGFQLLVIVAIVGGERLFNYFGDVYSECEKVFDDYDLLMMECDFYRFDLERAFGSKDSVPVIVDREFAEENDKQLFGGLEVGMSSRKIFNIVREKREALEDFKIGKVWFNEPDRFYYKCKLYGISMRFNDFYEEGMHAGADTVVNFLKQKYDEPHLYVNNEDLFVAEWHFEHKYIVVKTNISSSRYDPSYCLMIYQPALLKEKRGWDEEEENEEDKKEVETKEVKIQDIAKEEPIPEWKRKELENDALKNSL